MPNSQKALWIGLGVAAVAILGLGYLLFLAPEPEKTAPLPSEKSLVSEPPASDEAGPPADTARDFSPLQLDLDQSDATVRELIAKEPLPALIREWSQQKDLLRLLVAAVDNIARGESPVAQLAFMAPAGKFTVSEKQGAVYLDPQSYLRYDRAVDAFMAIPDDTLIYGYKKLSPTLEKAFRELGYPEVTFAQRLRQAIDHLSRLPALTVAPLLERKVLSYAFADPSLEKLSPAQKHLLRTGPQNMGRIQQKLRRLAAAL